MPDTQEVKAVFFDNMPLPVILGELRDWVENNDAGVWDIALTDVGDGWTAVIYFD